MSANRLISIVVPVYKVEKYLKRCIDSVLSQTMKAFELILVDDGSPDNCGEICDEYAVRDDRITVIHQNNAGLSAARNAGIEEALKSQTTWISFIDSDDWVEPFYLERLYNAALKTGLPLVVGGFAETRSCGIHHADCCAAVTTYEVENFYCTHKVLATVAWGKLYEKNVFRTFRYPVGKIHEDEFITHQIMFSYEQIAVIDQPLYFYFKNEQGIMRSCWNQRHVDESDAMKEQVLFFMTNGYNQAARAAARYYLKSLHRNLMNAIGQEADYADLCRQLHNRLRKEILLYGKRAGIYCKEYEWILYDAFPRITMPYRLFRKLANASLKRVGNE